MRLSVLVGAVGAVCALTLALAGCGGDDGGTNLKRAQSRVTKAQEALADAKAELADKTSEFCASTATYITALDRYGDILSARTGTIIASQDTLFNPPIPGGLPSRGVDFGVDAFAARCDGARDSIRFSTEIVYRDTPALKFSDGNLLKFGGMVVNHNNDFIVAFKPGVKDLGLDAIAFPADHIPCGDIERPFLSFLPAILKGIQLGGGQ